MTSSVETRLNGSTLIVCIPMRFPRPGGRKRIVAPDGSRSCPAPSRGPTARRSRLSRRRGDGSDLQESEFANLLLLGGWPQFEFPARLVGLTIPDSNEGFGGMDCPSCGAANPEAKSFCGDCGAALPFGCVLSASAANGLGRDAAPASPPPAAELSEGERRQVTVLFADLSGYTRLSREIDAEELHALAGRFFDAVDAVVEGYGGTVRKHIGDCIMAVFGAPVAHSNDSERAARAALEIQCQVSALADARGRPLGVHIGIASGPVVASGAGSTRHREYTVTGKSVNLASRLTDAAQAGEVLISDAVHRALAERLACAEAGRWRSRGSRSRCRPGVYWGCARPPNRGTDRSSAAAANGSGSGQCSRLARRWGTARRSTSAARLGSARRGWSQSSRRRRGARGSSATPARPGLRRRHRPGRHSLARAQPARPEARRAERSGDGPIFSWLGEICYRTRPGRRHERRRWPW